jgi:hypothetical protein
VIVEAAIVNSDPVRKRTIFTRGILDMLGLHHVRVGVSSKASIDDDHEVYDHEFDSSFMYDDKQFMPRKDTPPPFFFVF